MFGGKWASCDEEQWNFLCTKALAGMQLTRPIPASNAQKFMYLDFGLFEHYCASTFDIRASAVLSASFGGINQTSNKVNKKTIREAVKQRISEEEADIPEEERRRPDINDYLQAAAEVGQEDLANAVEERTAKRIERGSRLKELQDEKTKLLEATFSKLRGATGEESRQALEEVDSQLKRINEELEEIPKRKVTRRSKKPPPTTAETAAETVEGAEGAEGEVRAMQDTAQDTAKASTAPKRRVTWQLDAKNKKPRK